MQKAAKGRDHQSNHHPRNMVWKIRRNGRDPSHGAVASKNKGGQATTLKSCLKKDATADQHRGSVGSGSSGSSRKNCESTKSGGSRTGSRISNSSFHSKKDESRKDEPSCTSSSRSSNSSQSHSHSSSRQQNSAEIHTGSPQSSMYAGEKVVRFSEIQVREFERIVGDNPSCSAGPPIG
jgi:hypothetical protein